MALIRLFTPNGGEQMSKKNNRKTKPEDQDVCIILMAEVQHPIIPGRGSHMNMHFEGKMAIFPETVCVDANIFEMHSPTPGHNLHHWELYGNSQHDALAEEQIDALSEAIAFVSYQKTDSDKTILLKGMM